MVCGSKPKAIEVKNLEEALKKQPWKERRKRRGKREEEKLTMVGFL